MPPWKEEPEYPHDAALTFREAERVGRYAQATAYRLGLNSGAMATILSALYHYEVAWEESVRRTEENRIREQPVEHQRLISLE